MFVRMCPYFPFSARVCLNQHHWLAIRMREEGVDFQQCTSAFLRCGNPARLQELADSFTTQDLLKCGQKWLTTFTPFLSDRERKATGRRRIPTAASGCSLTLQMLRRYDATPNGGRLWGSRSMPSMRG